MAIFRKKIIHRTLIYFLYLSATLTAVCSPTPDLLAGRFLIAVSVNLEAVPGTTRLVSALPGRPIALPVRLVIGLP